MSSIRNRRRTLMQLAAMGTAGALGPAGLSGFIQDALAKGDLPGVPGVNSLTGSATVNGQPAKVGTPVKPGDKVATGKGSMAVVVVGKDAYLMREGTQVVFEQNNANPGIVSRVSTFARWRRRLRMRG